MDCRIVYWEKNLVKNTELWSTDIYPSIYLSMTCLLLHSCYVMEEVLELTYQLITQRSDLRFLNKERLAIACGSTNCVSGEGIQIPLTWRFVKVTCGQITIATWTHLQTSCIKNYLASPCRSRARLLLRSGPSISIADRTVNQFSSWSCDVLRKRFVASREPTQNPRTRSWILYCGDDGQFTWRWKRPTCALIT